MTSGRGSIPVWCFWAMGLSFLGLLSACGGSVHGDDFLGPSIFTIPGRINTVSITDEPFPDGLGGALVWQRAQETDLATEHEERIDGHCQPVSLRAFASGRLELGLHQTPPASLRNAGGMIFAAARVVLHDRANRCDVARDRCDLKDAQIFAASNVLLLYRDARINGNWPLSGKEGCTLPPFGFSYIVRHGDAYRCIRDLGFTWFQATSAKSARCSKLSQELGAP